MNMSAIEGLEYCPVCGKELVTYRVKYPKLRTVFKTDREILEIQKECKHCGWSTWSKQEE